MEQLLSEEVGQLEGMTNGVGCPVGPSMPEAPDNKKIFCLGEVSWALQQGDKKAAQSLGMSTERVHFYWVVSSSRGNRMGLLLESLRCISGGGFSTILTRPTYKLLSMCSI